MNTEQKNAWIAALRSGEFQQTRGRLYNDGRDDDRPIGYCCLGVLAKINDYQLSENGKEIIVNGENVDYQPLIKLLENSGYLYYDIYRLNDTEKMTFPEIADYIEANLQTVD